MPTNPSPIAYATGTESAPRSGWMVDSTPWSCAANLASASSFASRIGADATHLGVLLGTEAATLRSPASCPLLVDLEA